MEAIITEVWSQERETALSQATTMSAVCAARFGELVMQEAQKLI